MRISNIEQERVKETDDTTYFSLFGSTLNFEQKRAKEEDPRRTSNIEH